MTWQHDPEASSDGNVATMVILRLMRESGILVVTRITGLLLAAIAVQLVADAVGAFVESS